MDAAALAMSCRQPRPAAQNVVLAGIIGSLAAATVAATPQSAKAWTIHPLEYSTSSVALGHTPTTIAIDPATHRVYVGNTDGTVSVIDARTRGLIATVTVTGAVGHIAIDPATHLIYATVGPILTAQTLQWLVRVIDPTSLQVVANHGNLGLIAPTGIAIAPATHQMILTTASGTMPGAASIIDTVADTRGFAGSYVNPTGVAFDPTIRRIWVANGTTPGVVTTFTINDPTQTVVTLSVGSMPTGIAVDTTTDVAYVPNSLSGTVSVINGRTNATLATIRVGHSPLGVAVDASTHSAFVSDSVDNTVSVIDAATNTVTATMPVPAGASAIATDPSTHSVWLAHKTTGSVTVLNPVALRLSGADRFGTATAISAATFANNEADAVVLARADNYPDALVGTPLAAAKNAPLLFASGTTLPATTKDELLRVLTRGKTVYLLGGTTSIPDTVAAQLTGLGYLPVRLGGANRFATAVAVADALGDPGTVLLASGDGFADALTAGPAASQTHGVILLTSGSAMPPETAAYIATHAQTIYAIGGPAAAAYPTATAVSGSDRYATAVAVAQQFFPSAATAGVASGMTFPDALAAGSYLSHANAPLLLTEPATLDVAPTAYLQITHPGSAVLFGGPAALSAATKAEVIAAVGP